MRCLWIVALLAASAAPAAAQVEGFRSTQSSTACTAPGPAQHCGPSEWFFCWHSERGLYCRLTGAAAPRPDWSTRCEYSTGHAFGLRATGRASRACEEPLPVEGSPGLAEGATWERAGLRCAVGRDTLRCTNRGGHGFHLRPRQQDLF